MEDINKAMAMTLTTPKWKILLAKIFGRKAIWHDGKWVITYARYQGVTYIVGYEKE